MVSQNKLCLWLNYLVDEVLSCFCFLLFFYVTEGYMLTRFFEYVVIIVNRCSVYYLVIPTCDRT